MRRNPIKLFTPAKYFVLTNFDHFSLRIKKQPLLDLSNPILQGALININTDICINHNRQKPYNNGRFYYN